VYNLTILVEVYKYVIDFDIFCNLPHRYDPSAILAGSMCRSDAGHNERLWRVLINRDTPFSCGRHAIKLDPYRVRSHTLHRGRAALIHLSRRRVLYPATHSDVEIASAVAEPPRTR
jgi:hypothetical protein